MTEPVAVPPQWPPIIHIVKRRSSFAPVEEGQTALCGEKVIEEIQNPDQATVCKKCRDLAKGLGRFGR